MRWALVTMREPLAWRKISLRQVAGRRFEERRSFKTLPGPTLGSWSLSPIRMRRAAEGIAFRRWERSWVSIIDGSSTMIRSQRSGLLLFFLKPPLEKSISSRLWIVDERREVI